MSLRNLIIDLDSYFASVEQQMNPRLRGKPIAVAPVNTESTCCIAASKEAKCFGVKTGTRISDARKLCPGLEVVESNPNHYLEVHEEFLKAVDAWIPVADVGSIDEVECHLTGRLTERAAAEELARNIKQTVARRIGPYVTCSMGIAPNKFLAKVASDMKKPNGLHVIEKGDLPHALHGLKLRDFCGIGQHMERRLSVEGIRSVEQFTALSREMMHHVWGSIQGIHMWYWLRGEQTVPPETKKRVLGHSHVLPPHLRHEQGVHAVCHRLLQKAATRLRKYEYYTSSLEVFIKYEKGHTWSRDIHLSQTQDTLTLMEAFEKVWESRPRNALDTPKATGVTFSQLKLASTVTPDLFAKDRSNPKLMSALDEINRKMGKKALVFGGAMNALDYTPLRIAFTRIPDRDVET